jgi:nucleotide-binding universal stress UspA family protein
MGGEAGEAFAVQGRYSDLTVIGWPASDDTGHAKNLFEGALFHSGRPVLLVPERFTRHGCPKRVLIAWSPERESARAVNEALPLLQSADQVRIVVVDTGSSGPEANPGDDMARHLARRHVEVEVKHVPGSGEPVHRVIVKEGEYLGADLIVMGGYGHSRTGEWLFGGVTRDILRTTTVPLFMSH